MVGSLFGMLLFGTVAVAVAASERRRGGLAQWMRRTNREANALIGIRWPLLDTLYIWGFVAGSAGVAVASAVRFVIVVLL